MAKTQELVYNTPSFRITTGQLRNTTDIPLIKDVVALAFSMTVVEGSTGDTFIACEEAKNLIIRVYADSETIYMEAQLIRLVMARFYKLMPEWQIE